MARRIVGFFKNIKGSAETNLKNGENAVKSKKDELIAQMGQLKDRLPSIKDGIDAVKSVPSKIPDDLVKNRLRDLISKYEKFTGVDEIMILQKSVLEAQDKFLAAQESRREAGTKLMNLQRRVKDIHEEMQITPKGDQKYLKLITDEHNLIVEEQHLRKEFTAIEREEREHFNTMSAAVKLSHERERTHADRNKYWTIVASLVGTALGVFGSTLNNRMKMAEFREMLTEQVERSNNMLMTVGAPGAAMINRGSGAGSGSMPAAEMEKHRQQLRDVEMRVAAIANNQGTILEHMRKADKIVNVQLEDIKRLVMASMASSAKSDKALKEALKKASVSTDNSDLGSQTLIQKIQDNEEYVKMSFFVAIVLLAIYGIMGKMS